MLGWLPSTTLAPRVSPDGTQIAFDTITGVWIANLPTLTPMRHLTFFGAYPVWSTTGDQIVFSSSRRGTQALFTERSDGAGTATMLTRPGRAPESWSRAHYVSFITLTNGGDYDIWSYSPETNRTEGLIAKRGSAQHSSQFSPDGHSFAYASDESGRFEIYVDTFPPTGQRARLTHGGGEHPQWSPDGQRIYFDHENQVFSLGIHVSSPFSATAPQPLPIQGFIQGEARRQYDLVPDGTAFLMMFRVQR